MLDHHIKGERRISLDSIRQWGEPRANNHNNETLNSRYAAGAKAYRNKGRNRHKTGKKTKRSRKVPV